MMGDKTIKALECLKGYALHCRDCSYSVKFKFPQCQQKVAKDALDLINSLQAERDAWECEFGCLKVSATDTINRQKAEIQKQREDIHNRKAEANRLNSKIGNLKAEIKRLKEQHQTFEGVLKKCFLIEFMGKNPLAELRVKAYKEFAERLKNTAFSSHKSVDGKYLYELSNDFIDNLVKEMVGDDE